MKKILIILLSMIVITGCGNKLYNGYKITNEGKSDKKVNSYISLTYEEYKEKIDNKDSFLILLWQTGCAHCESFEPTLNNIISNFNLEIYGLNLAELNEEQYAIVKNKTFIQGTPTMVYFEEGKNNTKMVGNRSEEEVLKFLVGIGYLKER